MTLCVHGTTSENFKGILNGDEKPMGAWTVSSCDDAMYFYPLSKVEDEYEEEDREYALEHLIENAMLNAAVTASCELKSDKIVVMLVDVPDELLQDDYSCPNMSSCASFINVAEFSLEMVKKVFVFDFPHYTAPYFLPVGNRLLDTVNMDANFLRFVKAVSASSTWCDCYEEARDMVTESRVDYDFPSVELLKNL